MNRQSPYPLPEPGGPWGLPTALALLVHGVLIAALTWGVSWKQTPEPVLDAELWSALPQVAAPARVEPPVEPPVEAKSEPQPEPEAEPEPPAPPPPPPPPVKAPTQTKADIAAQKKSQDERKAKEQAAKEKLAKDKAANEKAAKDKIAKDKAAKDLLAKKKLAEDKTKKDKAAKEKAAKEQLAKDKAEKAQAAADAKRREAQRKEQIDRMLGQAGGQGNAAGSAEANSGPSASYGGRVAARIKPNVVLADPVVGNPRAEVEVRADADGKIISRRLVKSSGNAAWDQAVLRAIDRTGTLPRDTDGRVPSALIIGLRPQD
jgi:colicin import membrane protein